MFIMLYIHEDHWSASLSLQSHFLLDVILERDLPRRGLPLLHPLFELLLEVRREEVGPIPRNS